MNEIKTGVKHGKMAGFVSAKIDGYFTCGSQNNDYSNSSKCLLPKQNIQLVWKTDGSFYKLRLQVKQEINHKYDNF